jgi:hypothetical protein
MTRWGDMTAVQCRCRVMLEIMLSSHTGDDATEATWPWRDVDAESCWGRCCRVMLVIVLPGQLGHSVM